MRNFVMKWIKKFIVEAEGADGVVIGMRVCRDVADGSALHFT
jgi:hypothetical protein